jgi:hypothetical protein
MIERQKSEYMWLMWLVFLPSVIYKVFLEFDIDIIQVSDNNVYA